MNKNLYMITTRSGGEIKAVFESESEAKKYYNDNIRFNAIITELIPFKYKEYNYYYSVGNCIAIYNRRFEFLTKITNLDINNFTLEDIYKELEIWFNEEPPF